jgi:hypothetical protein
MEGLLNSDPQHETAAIVAIQTYVGNELVSCGVALASDGSNGTQV